MESPGSGPNAPSHAVTLLLRRWSAGEREAADDLMVAVYDDLRNVAARLMRGESAGATLQPTALVHEAWLRLAGQRNGFENRAQFFALAARCMRRILVDSARKREAAKRPSSDERVPIEEVELGTDGPAVELLDLDRALGELAKLDPRQELIVELHCFGGLTVDEVAPLLELSPRTVARDWKMARAFLATRLA